jgi:cytosine/adenosine deaminase-related metal-dependent hydrolase
LITPGFVDAHVHGESFALRFITGRHPSAVWPALVPLRSGLDTLLDPGATRQVSELYTAAGAAHLLAGTTTVGDYLLPYGAEGMTAAREGFERTGIRHAAVLQNWEQITVAQSRAGEPWRYTIALGREDQYTVYSIENLLRAAREHQCGVVAHLGEYRRDLETLRRNFKKPPLAVLREFGGLKPTTQLLHCNHLGATDLTAVCEAGGTITLCATSAAAKRTGYPLLTKLATHDVRLSLGTDWGAPGILPEVKFLRQLPRFAQGVRSFSPMELLRMATINGAYALGCAHQTGSLEVGKKADLVMFSLDDLRLPALSGRSTAGELADALVDHVGEGAITDVMVDGVFRVIDGRPARMDAHELHRIIRSLQENFPASPADVPASGPSEKGAAIVPPGDERYVRGEQDSPVPEHAGPGGPANLEPPAPPPQEERPATLPELSRTVKKVFGEDDY